MTMKWHLTIFLLCVVYSTEGNDYLLPKDVVPHHYDIQLLFDLDPATNFSFYGVVDILVTTKQRTNKIVLHAQDFNVSNDQIKIIGNDGAPGVKNVDLNDVFNFLTLNLNGYLEPNTNYTVMIPFFGHLKMGLDGAYISTYIDKTTKAKEYLIATQFEALSARKGFPCFDEPIYKATFSLTIGHGKNYNAVSNMPLLDESNENTLEAIWPDVYATSFKKPKSEFVWDQFEKSVPMSTYLVAYVVSKFSYVDSRRGLSKSKFRIWARQDAIYQTSYAAEIGPKVLTFYEDWFNVPFPLPKQDMFAIPDFAAGAMENWGLITYRETALLYDPKESSFLNKEKVAEVIAHELAHQWFGNLVTMKWWSDLWLNEGFATFVSCLGMHAVEPSWNADEMYPIYNILDILNIDALQSSHPVSVPLDDPKRISEIFDAISYDKGSALIRMMTKFLGMDVFRKSINNYLIKYSYKNAEQDDLWRELTVESHKSGILPPNATIKQIMDTWTTQTGYPLVTVTRNYEDKTFTLTQKRYLSLSPAEDANSASAATWWVPLQISHAGQQTEVEAERGTMSGVIEWLPAEKGFTVPHHMKHDVAPHQWLLFNTDMIAPYRINYDERNWKLLANAVKSKKMGGVPVLGRVQILSDAFDLAWTDRLDYSIVLHLASYLQNETKFLPFKTGLSALGNIEQVLKRSPDYGAYQKFVRKLVSDVYERSGGLAAKKILNSNDLDSIKMQVLTSNWACRMKVPGCEENAIEMFQSWMNTENPDENNPIPLDLRSTVYCVAISRGSVRHWRFALERKQRANVASVKVALLRALACTREVWILAQYLEWAITVGSDVRLQDAGMVIASITSSANGYHIAKNFIYNRIEDIYKAFQGQSRRIGAIIKTLLQQFTTLRELDEFLEWRKKHEKHLVDAKLSVEQAIEQAKVNIAWVIKHQHNVIAKMREFST